MIAGSTVERARGRWLEILPQLGVDFCFLTNHHGPCPLCGGKDRYRFDNKDGSGSYFCNQCGAGTGLILIKKLRKWDHATAYREVDSIIGRDPPRAPQQPKREPDREAAIRRLLTEATDQSVVDTYLSRRGLTVTSPVLRGHPCCPYFDETGRLIGRYPAVIAPIVGPNGRMQSVQRIYDAEVNPRKKTMPPVETIRGAAVRLHDSTDELGIAEGVVTALAAHELTGLPVWAALSAGAIDAFQPPPSVRRIVVFGDNDASFTGQAAAFALAKRSRLAGIEARVRIPHTPGADWRDVLTGEAPT